MPPTAAADRPNVATTNKNMSISMSRPYPFLAVYPIIPGWFLMLLFSMGSQGYGYEHQCKSREDERLNEADQ